MSTTPLENFSGYNYILRLLEECKVCLWSVDFNFSIMSEINLA